MFETQNCITFHIAIDMNSDVEALVVPHTHEVPSRIHRLRHVTLVPRSTHDLLSTNQISHRKVELPPNPTPVHSIFCWLFIPLNVAQQPIDSFINTDLYSSDLSPTTSVCVSCYFISALDHFLQHNCLIMVGLRNCRVDVEFVENVFWLIPPISTQTLFGSDVGRQDSVIMVMIVILCLVRNNIDSRKPLDHSSANVSRNDKAYRISMIRL
mmetsp:Transcript_352/g.456  ORF Transcript_352/g.456 Transcript_352/m.456 type:complete len:211 (+) Transcript_352:1309-1941(+)